MSPILRCCLLCLSLLAWRAEARAPIECGGYYIVQRGDYLAEIARRAYGNEAGWEDVWRPNRHILRRRNPSAVDIGAILWLPCPKADAARPAADATPPSADILASAHPPKRALWRGAATDPALARLKRALAGAELRWDVADRGRAGLRAPLERGACLSPACAEAIWSGVLREMVILSFTAVPQARGGVCVSLGAAALADRAGTDAQACLDAVVAGRAARAELTDMEAESLSIPSGLSERVLRIAPLRAAFPPDAARQAAAFDAALERVE